MSPAAHLASLADRRSGIDRRLTEMRRIAGNRRSHAMPLDCTLDTSNVCVVCGIYRGTYPCIDCRMLAFHKVSCSHVAVSK